MSASDNPLNGAKRKRYHDNPIKRESHRSRACDDNDQTNRGVLKMGRKYAKPKEENLILVDLMMEAELVGLQHRYTLPGIMRTQAMEKFACEAYLALNADIGLLTALIAHAGHHLERWDMDDFTTHLDKVEFYDRCSRRHPTVKRPKEAANQKVDIGTLEGTNRDSSTVKLAVERPSKKMVKSRPKPAPRPVRSRLETISTKESQIHGYKNVHHTSLGVSKVKVEPKDTPKREQPKVLTQALSKPAPSTHKVCEDKIPSEEQHSPSASSLSTVSQNSGIDRKAASVTAPGLSVIIAKRTQPLKRLQKKKPPTVLRAMSRSRHTATH